MPYEKPFRELPALIAELRSLGMSVTDEAAAIHFLRRVGYYRSGGYRYVFREKLPPSERDEASRTFRKPTYLQGSSLADVEKLEKFDAKLREICLSALSDFELRVRAAIAHTLGRRDVFAHTSISNLDPVESNKPTGRNGETKFSAWEKTYRGAINSSASEDFVAHLIVKYGHPLPIWATVDVLNFGNLPYLFELMFQTDRLEVSRTFGVTQEKKFGAWLRSMVDFRNYCAHSSRLFNRHFKRDMRIVPGSIDLAFLEHLTIDSFSVSESPTSRLYVNAALLAYMLRKHESKSNWNLTFRTHVRKLPAINLDGNLLITPERDMGFPADWDSLPLWAS